ncbi:MAG: leucine-rich repeat domain-containing protein [Saprospiraceae bacterium]|nr:leucine-rich repeat domain-containing protein [Saprospiraceae bacterium]
MLSKILIVCCFLFSIYNLSTVNAQIVDLPDENLKKALLEHDPVLDLNGDGEIQLTEAEAYKGTLYIADKGIEYIDGLGAFRYITGLECQDNQIQWLSVYHLNLTSLDCSSNRITTLDLSQHSALEELNCSGNKLKKLDLSQNEALLSLSCVNNKLKQLNLSANRLLVETYCDNNQLKYLAIGDKEQLKSLYCSENRLKKLDLRSLAQLELLNTKDNPNLDEINLNANLGNDIPDSWKKDDHSTYIAE